VRVIKLAREAVVGNKGGAIMKVGLAKVLLCCEGKKAQGAGETAQRASVLEEVRNVLLSAIEEGGEGSVEARVLLVTGGCGEQYWSGLDAVDEALKLHQNYELGCYFRKRKNCGERSKKYFTNCLAGGKEDPKGMVGKAEFWLSTLSGSSSADRCPASYVLGLYKGFAHGFDELLLNGLKYQTPTLMREAVERVAGGMKFNGGLDLGCGTGLSGVAFQQMVTGTFVGVDLSPNMVEKARERSEKPYSMLKVGDVESLDDEVIAAGPYELIVCCDVFVYVGASEASITHTHT